MCQLDRLHQLKAEIYQIAQKHNAEKVYVFGSCARKEEKPESDIDLMVLFRPNASFFDQIRLEHELTELLQSKVDVVDLAAVREGYFKDHVMPEMTVI